MRVKGGVEAGDLLEVGPQPLQGADGGGGGPVVERGEVGQLIETGLHLPSKADRLAELGPPVNHPVPGSPHLRRAGQEPGQHRPHAGRALSRQALIGQHRVVTVEHPELQAARPGVDHEDLHR